VPTYDVEIVITIDFAATNASQSEIREIVWDFVLDEILLILPNVTENELDERSELNAEDLLYTFTVTVTVPNEASADIVVEAVESNAFLDELEEHIESETNNVVAENGITSSAAATANVDEEEVEDEVDWMDPTTYKLLNWIVVGSAGCLVLIFCVCLLRCLCIVCCKEKQWDSPKRGGHKRVDSTQPLFEVKAKSVSKDNGNAFTSDLNKAIELQNRGKLLKKTNSKHKVAARDNSMELEHHEVEAAFDMHFDDIGPNGAGNGNLRVNPDHVSKADDSDTESVQRKNSKNSKAAKRKKSSSKEKGRGSLMKSVTPGGPDHDTPGGPDDDINPPPAPDAPSSGQRRMTEIEAEAAYDLL